MAESNTVEASTTVRRVTFFEDRAEVVRVLTVTLPAGRSRIHAHGLTLLVDDRSIACKSTDAQIVYSRVRRRVEEVAKAEELAALETDRERTRDRVARIDAALERANADTRRTEALFREWTTTLATVPSRAEEAAVELSSAYDALDAATTATFDGVAALRSERDVAHGEAVRADMALANARAKKPRYEAFVELEVIVANEGSFAIELTYRTPCALWRPEHLARLTRDATKAEITITTYATVWQMTGESWNDVPCRFSTARPAKSASAPLLPEDILFTQKKTEIERKRIVVEARDQTVNLAGTDRGTRDVDEMPGVDDGGQAQWLDARENATIESDGRPTRIEIGQRTLACEVERVCFPERSPATHVRARATLSGGPLLAGAVTVARESELVGRSQTSFVGAGEPFELGFGVEDGIRVHRKQTEKRKTTPVTGTQHIAREVRLYLSNLSDDTRAVTIIERVPVSEVEDVEVHVVDTAFAKRDAKNGFVTIEQELPPRGTRDLLLEYRIEASSNVVLP